jgi:hypothetical protein
MHPTDVSEQAGWWSAFNSDVPAWACLGRGRSVTLRTDTHRTRLVPLTALRPPCDVVEALVVARRMPPGSHECIAFPTRNDVEVEVEDVVPASCSVGREECHAVGV